MAAHPEMLAGRELEVVFWTLVTFGLGMMALGGWAVWLMVKLGMFFF